MIRFTYTYLKPVALFLSIAFLFQCCSVFVKKRITIEEAINKDDEEAKYIKIITKSKHYRGEYQYESIYYKDKVLYGINKTHETFRKNGQVIPIGPEEIYEEPINEDHIKRIYLLTPRKE